MTKPTRKAIAISHPLDIAAPVNNYSVTALLLANCQDADINVRRACAEQERRG